MSYDGVLVPCPTSTCESALAELTEISGIIQQQVERISKIARFLTAQILPAGVPERSSLDTSDSLPTQGEAANLLPVHVSMDSTGAQTAIPPISQVEQAVDNCTSLDQDADPGDVSMTARSPIDDLCGVIVTPVSMAVSNMDFEAFLRDCSGADFGSSQEE